MKTDRTQQNEAADSKARDPMADLVAASNPTLREILRALAVAPGNATMLVSELSRKGSTTSLIARVEVRLISTEDSLGNVKHWNVSAGNYEGEPKAGNC